MSQRDPFSGKSPQLEEFPPEPSIPFTETRTRTYWRMVNLGLIIMVIGLLLFTVDLKVVSLLLFTVGSIICFAGCPPSGKGRIFWGCLILIEVILSLIVIGVNTVHR